MSEFTFRLSFSGLCAFVPRGIDPEAPVRMDVFLLKTSDFDCKHLPLLSFDLRNLNGVDREQIGDAKGLWIFDDEDVELALFNRETGLEEALDAGINILQGRRFPEKPIYDPNASDPDLDFEMQRADFSWLPEMEKILPVDAMINEDVFADNPRELVVARFRIAQGDFGSHYLGEHLGDFVVIQFVPPMDSNNPYSQAVAHWAGAELLVDQKYDIIVRSTTYRHDETKVLRLIAPEDGSDLIVNVTNLCEGYFDDADDSAEEYRVSDPKKFDVDHDFDEFYSIGIVDRETLKKWFPRLPVPVATKYNARPEGGSVGGVDPVRCSGVRFKQSPL